MQTGQLSVDYSGPGVSDFYAVQTAELISPKMPNFALLGSDLWKYQVCWEIQSSVSHHGQSH